MIENDNKKRFYAYENNITLIEVPYTENSNDKVNRFLSKILNKKGLI